MRQNAILLFSKVPEAGKTKTRLSTIKDGRLTPEWAAYLYHCMLFDVAECCCSIVQHMQNETDSYRIIISSPGVEQREAMEQLFAESGDWPCEFTFISDTGTSFDEHYNDSFAQVWEMGFDTILSMGCDMPALTGDIIMTGFNYLHEFCERDMSGIVLSPDQEMGVSIVGWTRQTPFDHTGVFYNADGLTVLPAYIQKAQRLGLPVMYLPAMPDVDTMADLRHNVTLIQAIEYCAPHQWALTTPWRTLDAVRQLGYRDIRVMPNDLRDDRSEIDK